eukprot:1891793-Rhodomonas_salina.4
MSGTDFAYGSTRLFRTAQDRPYKGSAQVPIVLRVRYAMSGTDVANPATRYFKLVGSPLNQVTLPEDVQVRAISLRACYAMSGTGAAQDNSAYQYWALHRLIACTSVLGLV